MLCCKMLSLSLSFGELSENYLSATVCVSQLISYDTLLLLIFKVLLDNPSSLIFKSRNISVKGLKGKLILSDFVLYVRELFGQV